MSRIMSGGKFSWNRRTEKNKKDEAAVVCTVGPAAANTYARDV